MQTLDKKLNLFEFLLRESARWLVFIDSPVTETLRNQYMVKDACLSFNSFNKNQINLISGTIYAVQFLMIILRYYDSSE